MSGFKTIGTHSTFLLPHFFDSPKVGRCGAGGDPEVGSTQHILKFFTEYLSARGGEEPMRALLNAYRGTFHLKRDQFWLEPEFINSSEIFKVKFSGNGTVIIQLTLE